MERYFLLRFIIIGEYFIYTINNNSKLYDLTITNSNMQASGNGRTPGIYATYVLSADSSI